MGVQTSPPPSPSVTPVTPDPTLPTGILRDDVQTITTAEIQAARSVVSQNMETFETWTDKDASGNYVVSEEQANAIKEKMLEALGRTDLKADDISITVVEDRKDGTIADFTIQLKKDGEVIADLI